MRWVRKYVGGHGLCQRDPGESEIRREARSGTLATLMLSLSVPVLGGIASAADITGADPLRTIQQSIRDISHLFQSGYF